MKIRVALVLVALAVFASPPVVPAITARLSPPQDTAARNAMRIVDTALHALSAPNAEPRAILANAVTELARREGSTAATIQNFLTRAPAIGSDFKCGADFVRHRARKMLVGIKADLFGTGSDPVQPQACYATPFALDLTRQADALEIYGYDFDRTAVQMFLVASDGVRDVSSSLIHRTHYHLTLPLGKGGVELTPSTRVLGLAWGNLIHYSVPTVQSTTRLCRSRIDDIPAGHRIEFTPERTGGTWFRDARMSLTANLELDYDLNELDATVCMTAADTGADHDALSACVAQFVATIDPDRAIEGIVGGSASRVEDTRSRSNRVALAHKDGPVRQWIVDGFGGTTSQDSDPTVSIALAGIRVASTETDGCLSPIAYLEAKRTRVLDPSTVRALDRQLGSVNAAIVKLRPRFAPPLP
jgi:hypothetical protein